MSGTAIWPKGSPWPARDLAQALPKMEAGLARSPNSADGWFSYAEALRRSAAPREAETAVRRAIAIDRTEGRHYYGLGHTLAELGRLDEAAQAAERAVALDPSDPHFHGLSANIASRRGRLAEAEAFARQAIETRPGQPAHAHMLADILLRQDRPGRIHRGVAARRSRSNRTSRDSSSCSAGPWRAPERMAEAIAAARHAVALDPDNASIQGHLGTLLVQSGDVQDAETNLQALLAANPDDAGLYEQYGHLLARLGRPDEAEAAFRRAMDLAPNAAGPLAGLSHTLARLGRHHEAIAAIEAAIEFEPTFLAVSRPSRQPALDRRAMRRGRGGLSGRRWPSIPPIATRAAVAWG